MCVRTKQNHREGVPDWCRFVCHCNGVYKHTVKVLLDQGKYMYVNKRSCRSRSTSRTMQEFQTRQGVRCKSTILLQKPGSSQKNHQTQVQDRWCYPRYIRQEGPRWQVRWQPTCTRPQEQRECS